MTITPLTPICLFDRDLNMWSEVAATSPDWQGSLVDFLRDNPELTETELRPLFDDLDVDNLTHLNGGAGGITTICTVASRETALTWALKPARVSDK